MLIQIIVTVIVTVAKKKDICLYYSLDPMKIIIMKMLFFFCVAVIATACTIKKEETITDDCATVDCMPANGIFYIKLVDKKTGTDLVANKSFDTTGVKVTNRQNDNLLLTNISGVDSLKSMIYINDNSQSGINNLYITASSKTFTISYNYSYKPSGCCGLGSVKNIKVADGYTYRYYTPVGITIDNIKIVVIEL
ncbi:MAG: hypothetical protein ACK5NK_07850 [Niabella sp.]